MNMNEHKARTPKNKPNALQQKAIDAIEGPVMVIAGPGTGKTEILSLRIANILERTDAGAQHILCLTYTEAGTVAMRQRLLEHIGTEAYNVHIHTFHSFCNKVIQENLDYFGSYRELQPVSELEEVMLFNEMIDDFPYGHPLKRLTGDVYYDRKPMKHLFDTMKQENWSPDYVLKQIDRYLESERESEKYIYKRKSGNNKKGDFKEKDFQKLVDKMDRLRAGVGEFGNFQERLKEAGRYDYNDMLQWVNRGFAENADLLADYQEQYLYILVDEFQDTNGIQVDILNQLAGYWDRPNLFVVGDDDQAIYRFQGANLENMKAFVDRYAPEVIVLTDNYRSTQKVLDASMKLIDRNEARLVKQFPQLGLSKELVAQAAFDSKPTPRLVAFPNEAHEQAAIARMIMEANADPGRDAGEIAVIYRSHKQVDEIVKALDAQGIPLNIRKKVDILAEPLIRNILTVMEYISGENQGVYGEDQQLFRVMHYRFFDIEPTDIALLLMEYQKLPREDRTHGSFRLFLSDQAAWEGLSLKNAKKIARFISLIDQIQKEVEEVSLQSFFEHLIYRSGIMEYVLTGQSRNWHLQLVTTLFDFIKEETDKKPEMGLSDFLQVVQDMRENDVRLPAQKVIQSDNGVNFITAHSAKGLEFDEVYLIGCRKDRWEKQRARSDRFSFPDTLVSVRDEHTEEDERRLFYVAMTRARKKLVVSYAREDKGGKSLEASKFFKELIEFGGLEEEEMVLPDEDFHRFYTLVFTLRESRVPMIDKVLVDRVLEKFELSVTALNKYLECPRAFYFETILRVPAAKAAHMGFGSAIHYALEHYFEERLGKGDRQAGLDVLLGYFRKGMERNRSNFSQKEFEDRMYFGNEILSGYYAQYQDKWREDWSYRFELGIDHAEFQGIPVKGKLDKVIIYPGGATVVDYKTGKYENGVRKLKPPTNGKPGENYWRQIVFYKILTMADKNYNLAMKDGVIDFVQPAKDGAYKQRSMEVTSQDIEVVAAEMTEVYDKIRAYEFHEGCGECEWCALVNNHFVVDEALAIPRPDPDE